MPLTLLELLHSENCSLFTQEENRIPYQYPAVLFLHSRDKIPEKQLKPSLRATLSCWGWHRAGDSMVVGASEAAHIVFMIRKDDLLGVLG